jgi:hypothetical protein
MEIALAEIIQRDSISMSAGEMPASDAARSVSSIRSRPIDPGHALTDARPNGTDAARHRAICAWHSPR